jgi:hypothetical protein
VFADSLLHQQKYDRTYKIHSTRDKSMSGEDKKHFFKEVEDKSKRSAQNKRNGK